MRIVHVAEPLVAGVATFVRSLVEGMREDSHVIVHGERPQLMISEKVIEDFPRDNVRFIRWRSAQREIRPVKDLRALIELYLILLRLKKSSGIDVVHLHSSKSGFIGRLACRAAGIRQVVYTPNGAPFLGGSGLTRFVFRQLERIAAVFGGQVVCCSPSEHVAYRDIGIHAARINNGVAVPKRRETTFDGSSCFRVVTCGRIIGQKNPTLFNEIASYFEDVPGIEFIWVGDGEDRALLTAKNVSVTGWLPWRSTQRHLSAASIYISTSNFEGMPFAVLEALVLKKTVLLKDCVGNRDIVTKGINGDLFQTAGMAILKILQYHNNREMLSIMGENSQRHCEREFDLTSMSSAYRNLYVSKNQ
ncbi:MAG: glycosyl transferase family 1 [Bacteroidetes bacterium]|nr:MAG: glycosyl transferase family 1 [Bacteroidota bacterium]